jgi:hypothetical protein
MYGTAAAARKAAGVHYRDKRTAMDPAARAWVPVGIWGETEADWRIRYDAAQAKIQAKVDKALAQCKLIWSERGKPTDDWFSASAQGVPTTQAGWNRTSYWISYHKGQGYMVVYIDPPPPAAMARARRDEAEIPEQETTLDAEGRAITHASSWSPWLPSYAIAQAAAEKHCRRVSGRGPKAKTRAPKPKGKPRRNPTTPAADNGAKANATAAAMVKHIEAWLRANDLADKDIAFWGPTKWNKEHGDWKPQIQSGFMVIAEGTTLSHHLEGHGGPASTRIYHAFEKMLKGHGWWLQPVTSWAYQIIPDDGTTKLGSNGASSGKSAARTPDKGASPMRGQDALKGFDAPKREPATSSADFRLEVGKSAVRGYWVVAVHVPGEPMYDPGRVIDTGGALRTKADAKKEAARYQRNPEHYVLVGDRYYHRDRKAGIKAARQGLRLLSGTRK